MFFFLFDKFSFAKAERITVGNIAYNMYDNKTLSVMGFVKEEKVDSLLINGTIEYEGNLYKVTSIGESSFENYDLHGTVTFPDEILYIFNKAFFNTSISSVKFGNNLKEIGDLAFAGTDISELKLPNSLEVIGFGSFTMDGKKSGGIRGNLTIPDSVVLIKEGAFYETSISSVKFGSGLKEIQKNAFGNCKNLCCELRFPDSLEIIGDACFINTQITGTVDGSKLKHIGICCFQSTYIKKFIFPQEMIKIPDFLFSFSLLEGEVFIPKTVEEIGDMTFAQTKITSINFPISLKVIQNHAFIGCSQLNTSFPLLQEFEYIGWEAFSLSSINVNQGFRCNEIASYSFSFCNSITNNLILRTNKIGTCAFWGCSNIVTADIRFRSNSDNTLESTFTGCLSLKTVMIIVSNQRPTIIGNYTFAFCENLKEIKFPNTVEKICDFAFYSCSSYSSNLNLSMFENLTYIGKSAFSGCKSLFGELKLPSKLTIINDNAFAGCSFSGSVFIPDNVTYVGNFAFYECTKLSGIIYIGNSVTNIGESAFSMCKNISGNIIFGPKVSKIGDSAFFGCSLMKGNLIFPDSLVEIGDSAFYECKGLEGRLIFKSNLKRIGRNAFSECSSFTGHLIIPESVDSIGENAFFGCKGFKDVYFENDEVSVGRYSFANMNVFCFSNSPSLLKSIAPEDFGFNKIITPGTKLNFYCTSYYGINYFLFAFIGICGVGLLTTAGNLLGSWYNNRKTNITKYTLVFSDIIETALSDKEKSKEDIANEIVNMINESVSTDMIEEEFSVTENQAEKALKASIEEKWPIIPLKYEKLITKRAFSDVIFKSYCTKCKLNCKRRPEYTRTEVKSSIELSIV